ncbi:MAG: copper amine oxidase N-terminal domain-containing protein [Bacillota bacterium]
MKRFFTLIVCIVFSLSLCTVSYAKGGGGGGSGNSGSHQGSGKAGTGSAGAKGENSGKVEAAGSETTKMQTENKQQEVRAQETVKTPPARQKGINPSVKVRGYELKFDVPPVIKEGRTLIPVRAIMNSLGAEVKWDGATKTVTVIRGEQTIVFVLDSRTVTVNGAEQQIDYPAQLISSRTFVPIRFIAETFGAKVSYDENSDTVIVEDGTGSIQPGSGTDSPTSGSTGDSGSNSGTGSSTTGSETATQTEPAQTGGTQTDTTQTGTTQNVTAQPVQ